MCSRLKLTALNGYSEVALELFILLRKGQQKCILAIISDFPVVYYSDVVGERKEEQITSARLLFRIQSPQADSLLSNFL